MIPDYAETNMPQRRHWLLQLVPFSAVVMILLILPAFLPFYLQNIMSKAIIFALFAMSLDIVMGYTGLISLGHAAFFGVGGYAAAILIRKCGITSFWIICPLAILITAASAAILGIIALRVSGIYFLLVTLALSLLLQNIANKWYSLTRGTDGILGIPSPDLGLSSLFSWSPTRLYYFILIIVVTCSFLLLRIVNSPFGNALQGIRENEQRMAVLGYNTWLYKYLALIIGGSFAGVAGILFAHYNGIIAPFHLGITTSTFAMLMCIIGGLGTIWGPIIGSFIIIVVEYFSSILIPERWPLVLGGVFVISVMTLRGGIAQQLLRLKEKLFYGSTKG